MTHFQEDDLSFHLADIPKVSTSLQKTFPVSGYQFPDLAVIQVQHRYPWLKRKKTTSFIDSRVH